MDVVSLKAEIRRRMRERMQAVTREESVDARVRIFETLWESSLFDDGTRLLAFYPHRNEIDCRHFLRIWLARRRELFLPRVARDGEELELWRVPHILAVKAGYRSMLEPDPDVCVIAGAEEIDAVLVPGLAFDRTGTRLGQGGGHYDRLLARLPASIRRIGLAYDWQLSGNAESPIHGLELPREHHDERMHFLATPSGISEFDDTRTS